MTVSTRHRDRRALVCGGGIVALAVAIRFLAVPYVRTVLEVRSELADQRAQLAREREVLGQNALLPAAAEGAIAELDARVPDLLPGETPSEAQAALTERVDSIADRQRVALTRLQALPTTPLREGLLAVPLRIEGESDLQGVLGLLAALEGGRWPVRIESLAMESRAGREGRATTGPAAAEVLGFRFTAVGFALADSTPAAAGPGGQP